MPTKNVIKLDWKVLAVIVGLAVQVGAIGAFYGKTTTRLDAIDKQLAKIEKQVEGGTNQRYREPDAERDFRLRDERLKALADRVDKLEKDM